MPIVLTPDEPVQGSPPNNPLGARPSLNSSRILLRRDAPLDRTAGRTIWAVIGARTAPIRSTKRLACKESSHREAPEMTTKTIKAVGNLTQTRGLPRAETVGSAGYRHPRRRAEMLTQRRIRGRMVPYSLVQRPAERCCRSTLWWSIDTRVWPMRIMRSIVSGATGKPGNETLLTDTSSDPRLGKEARAVVRCLRDGPFRYGQVLVGRVCYGRPVGDDDSGHMHSCTRSDVPGYLIPLGFGRFPCTTATTTLLVTLPAVSRRCVTQTESLTCGVPLA